MLIIASTLLHYPRSCTRVVESSRSFRTIYSNDCVDLQICFVINLLPNRFAFAFQRFLSARAANVPPTNHEKFIATFSLRTTSYVTRDIKWTNFPRSFRHHRKTLLSDDLWTSHQRKISTENQIKHFWPSEVSKDREREKNLSASARSRYVIGVWASTSLRCKQINI